MVITLYSCAFWLAFSIGFTDCRLCYGDNLYTCFCPEESYMLCDYVDMLNTRPSVDSLSTKTLYVSKKAFNVGKQSKAWQNLEILITPLGKYICGNEQCTPERRASSNHIPSIMQVFTSSEGKALPPTKETIINQNAEVTDSDTEPIIINPSTSNAFSSGLKDFTALKVIGFPDNQKTSVNPTGVRDNSILISFKPQVTSPAEFRDPQTSTETIKEMLADLTPTENIRSNPIYVEHNNQLTSANPSSNRDNSILISIRPQMLSSGEFREPGSSRETIKEMSTDLTPTKNIRVNLDYVEPICLECKDNSYGNSSLFDSSSHNEWKMWCIGLSVSFCIIICLLVICLVKCFIELQKRPINRTRERAQQWELEEL